MSVRHAVWIGAAGSVTGHGVAARIRAAWPRDVRIIAADINPPSLVAAADLADAVEQVPLLADRDAFITALRAGLERHGADTYVPLLVDEIAIAAALARELGHVRVLAPSPETARLCTDKLALMRTLEAAGVSVPPTALAGEAEWWPEGVVVKDRGGEGSRGVERIDDPAALERVRARGAAAIAQRRCEPPEVTVDAFRAQRDGAWSAVCRERIEVRAGVSTKARLFRDHGLERLVHDVAEALDLRGALCVQAMIGPDGWEITDVNPRCGGGTPMSAAAGTDVIAAALADLWDEDATPFLVPFRGQAHVVRSYRESVRPLPGVLAFDLDGTLLDCRARQVAVARHVSDGLDEDRFWHDKRAGATTAEALAAQGAERADHGAAWIEQIEDDGWLALDRPLPGATEALEEARRLGLRPVVVTARRDAGAVRRQVAALKLADPADVLVVDPTDAASAKAAILRDLDAVGFVGDNESDGRAATLAGVAFACVDTGQRSEAFLRAHGFDAVPGGVLGAVRTLVAAGAAEPRR